MIKKNIFQNTRMVFIKINKTKTNKMTYFSKNFSTDTILPDGTVANSVYEIDRYLKANNLASSSDYSEQYFKNIQNNKEKTQQKEIFAELVQQYKKRIWNE